MFKNQNGFTLVELVFAIIILGILAAVAVPKFLDIRSEAQNAAAHGVASSIVSTASMLHTQFNVKGSVYMLGTTGGNDLQVLANVNVSGGPQIVAFDPDLTVSSNSSSLITITVNDAPYTLTLTLNNSSGPQATYGF